MRSLSTVSAVAAALALCSGASHANLLVNGSFEQGAYAETAAGYMHLPAGSTAMTGWTTQDNFIAWASPGNADGIVAHAGGFRSI